MYAKRRETNTTHIHARGERGGGGGGGGRGGGRVTSYMWHSTDVRAEWPPSSALPDI